MDIRTTDTSVPRARQLRDEPPSGRYPPRGYQQRQPSRERGAADQTDLKNDEHGTSVLRKELTTVRPGEVCPVDRRQPYQRLPEPATKLTHVRFRREELGKHSGRVSFRVSLRWQNPKTEANESEPKKKSENTNSLTSNGLY